MPGSNPSKRPRKDKKPTPQSIGQTPKPRDSQRSEGPGSEPIGMKWLRRYGNPFDQLEAEGDFIERRRKCDAHLKSLTEELAAGDINGFRELLHLAHDATEIVNRFAQAEPHLAAAFAENYSSWPILWTGATLSREHQKWLKRIRLGAAKPEVVGPRSIGQYPPLTRKWAILLLNIIESIRWIQGVRRRHEPYFWSLTRMRNSFQIPTEDIFDPDKSADAGFSRPKEIDIMDLLKENPDLSPEAKKLAPFGYATREDWWCVAEMLFDRITAAGLINFPGLSRLAKTEKVLNLEKSAGTHRSEVMKYIKPVFLNLARL